MNFTVWHDVAPSGAAIGSSVTLLLPADDEPFPKLPWRAETRVDCHRMITSHHATRADATTAAERGHASYLAVHADYPEYRALRAAELQEAAAS